MLTTLDDLLTHQTFDTHDRVFMDDARWTERFIIEVHDRAGEVLMHTGLGIYPNTQYMDGFAVVWQDGEQRNLRVGRELGEDRWRLGAGPLAFEIVDPLRTWRMTCAPGAHGFSFDLTFERRTQAYQMPTQKIERDGFLLVGYSHFVQAGTYSGWIEIDGRRHDATGWTGERDRSWGVRPASARVRRGLHTWLPMQWDDLSIWIWTHDDQTGEQDGLCGAIRPVAAGPDEEPGPPIPVTSYRQDLQIELIGPHRVLTGATLQIGGADGSVQEIDVKPMAPLMSIIGGGYGGEHPQGTPKGELYVEHERWATDPQSFAAIPHSILERSCVFTRSDGAVGHGEFELCIGRHDRLGLGPID
jgi:hypothetical protein